jgi:enoyl-CoA hydratase/carnithine racemase
MIRHSDDGPLRTVTIDRPERRNALRPEDLDALVDAVTGAAGPVVYVHGAGDAFCAGADFDVVASLEDPYEFARHGQRTLNAVADAEAVVVAGIDGAARGGGVELALACDMRVATPDASLAEPGVQFGLFGAWGGTIRLPRTVSAADAADIALSGRSVDAEEALRMGLVSRVVDDPRTVAEEVAENKADALAHVKERLWDRTSDEERERAEAAAFEELLAAYADDIAAMRE